MSTRTMNKKMRNTISLLEVTTRIVQSCCKSNITFPIIDAIQTDLNCPSVEISQTQLYTVLILAFLARITLSNEEIITFTFKILSLFISKCYPR